MIVPFWTLSSFITISDWIISKFLEKDLGSKSKVSVSPTNANSLSNKITRSRFWNINLVENKNFLKDLSSINPGDFIIHVDHGLGKFINLTNLKIENSYHECLMLEYRNNDRLYLPVENLEMLSKYNSDNDELLTTKAIIALINKIRPLAASSLKNHLKGLDK